MCVEIQICRMSCVSVFIFHCLWNLSNQILITLKNTHLQVEALDKNDDKDE